MNELNHCINKIKQEQMTNQRLFRVNDRIKFQLYVLSHISSSDLSPTLLMRNSTILFLPFSIAICNGVFPSFVLAFISAF